jgi:tight adherence protein B
MALLLALMTFLIVVTVLLLPVLVPTGRGSRQMAQRLIALEKARARGSASPELDLLRNELLSDVPVLHRLLSRWKWSTAMQQFVSQAGLKIKPGRLVLMGGVLGLVGYLVVAEVLNLPLLALPIGALCAAIPFLFVLVKRWQRLRAFERSFPEAIDLLGRAVRAGHAFTTGLEMIGKELGEPVAGEFRITFEEQNFGLPLKDALLNLAERVPLIDVRFFVVALLIQKETGGNLAEILDNLSRVIRERFKIYGEVRIRTAQGRLTAAILIALPPAMMLLVGSINPNYMKPLYEDTWGHYMLAGAALLQIVGSILLWRIVNIEV